MPSKSLTSEFLSFVNASHSPFHAVETSVAMLRKAGYKRVSETATPDEWARALQPGSKVFFTRNQSTVFAFAVGKKYVPGNGLALVGAHTDSPCLRVKPVSAVAKHGCLQVGVECYGGGLWNTWFDRDLSVAGRVLVARDDGSFQSQLVDLKRAVLHVPSLAIHLNRSIYEKGFKPNFETEVLPVLATALNAETKEGAAHHPALLSAIAEELKCSPEQIRDFELSLYDTQESGVGGVNNEFIHSARLDNLFMSFCSLRALIKSSPTLSTEDQLRGVLLFDHEEIGSSSAQGAASNMLASTLQRVAGEHTAAAVRKSLLVSADMAHALHPNYADKHEQNHGPLMHKGVVIKFNTKQRYATNAVGALVLKELAAKHGIPVQEFVVRNDMGCGSTIGPILASNTGMRTVDVGVAQWAMHSIRETCGVQDVAHAVDLLEAFFNEYGALYKRIQHAD